MSHSPQSCLRVYLVADDEPAFIGVIAAKNCARVDKHRAMREALEDLSLQLLGCREVQAVIDVRFSPFETALGHLVHDSLQGAFFAAARVEQFDFALVARMPDDADIKRTCDACQMRVHAAVAC